MFHRAGGCLSVRGAVRGSAPEWNGRYIDYKSPLKVMKFFRVPANTLPRWKIALYRPSYASSVRWLSFLPFFFFWRWEDSWDPFVTASPAGSFLSLIIVLQHSWSPQKSCFLSPSLSSGAALQLRRRHPRLPRLCSCNATALAIRKF